MQYIIEVEREENGRWITEIPELPGVLAYGESRQEAIVRARALALRVLADRIEHGESLPEVARAFGISMSSVASTFTQK